MAEHYAQLRLDVLGNERAKQKELLRRLCDRQEVATWPDQESCLQAGGGPDLQVSGEFIYERRIPRQREREEPICANV